MDIGPLGGQHPLGFVTIIRTINPYTSEWIDNHFEIHRDDLEWAMRLWGNRCLLDWQLDQAEHERTITP